MQFTAAQISELLGGRVEGNPHVTVSRPAKIEEADEQSICFYANPKYEHYVYTTKAAILLVSLDFQPTRQLSATLVRVPDVYSAVSRLLEAYQTLPKTATQAIHDLAFVHPTAQLGEGVSVAAFAYVGAGAVIGDRTAVLEQAYLGEGVRIGADCVVYQGAKIMKDTEIGDRCTFFPNSVVGADGFGFAPQPDGTYRRIPHVGKVVIGNDVELGALSAIDRATMGATVVKDGVKLDNIVQIGHNVELGENTVMAAFSGIAGSTKVGSNCQFGAKTWAINHLTIADGSKFQSGTGLFKSLKDPDKAWRGVPAIENNAFNRAQIIFQQLPQLEKRVRELEAALRKLSPPDAE